MLKNNYLFISILLLSSFCFGQKKYISKLISSNNIPQFKNTNGTYVYKGSNNKEQLFFDNNPDIKIYQYAPSSRREEVLRFAIIECFDEKDIETLMNEFPGIYLSYSEYEEPILASSKISEDYTQFNVDKSTHFSQSFNAVEPPPYFPNDYVTVPVDLPNDYNIFDVNDLEYINTTKAWGIAGGGNSNIIIGISDGKIEDEDVELDGKVNFPNGDPFDNLSPYDTCNIVANHGTGSAVTAAGKGDNNYGTIGVCYECSINGDSYNFPALLRLAMSGARIINASWVNFGGGLPPEIYIQTTFGEANYEIIQEIIEDYGAIIVAGAGNSMQYDSQGNPITQYNYPASFDEVISVSSVNHWYELDNHPLTPWATCNPPDLGLFRIRDVLVSGLIVSTDPPELFTYTCPNGASGPPGLIAGPPHVINDQVDILTPNYQVINYPKMIYGICPSAGSSKYAWGTSHGAPLVSGTIGLMLSLDECLDYLEVDDILKLTSKSIRHISYNDDYIELAGSGAMQTGDAVSFVYQMNQIDGNAVIKDQTFNRFEFNLQRIKNDLTIDNVQFLENNISYFNVENSITITDTQGNFI